MRTAITWTLWLAATILLAFTVLYVYAAGGSDAATDSERMGLGAVGVALAWPLLIGVAHFGFSERGRHPLWRAVGLGTLLTAYPAIVFAVAWHAAHGPTFSGDSRWAAYWLVSLAGWVAVNRKRLSPKGSTPSPSVVACTDR